MTLSEKLLAKIESDTFSVAELKTLKTNALARTGHEEIVKACDEKLAAMARATGKGKEGPDHVVAQERDGYVVMVSATDIEGNVLVPEHQTLAEFLSRIPTVAEVAILKTQLRFYLKHHHMVCGLASPGGYFVGVLDQTKVTDDTLAAWEAVGPISRGTYFSTKYCNVLVQSHSQIVQVLESTTFLA
jgi:hypothetical protein